MTCLEDLSCFHHFPPRLKGYKFYSSDSKKVMRRFSTTVVSRSLLQQQHRPRTSCSALNQTMAAVLSASKSRFSPASSPLFAAPSTRRFFSSEKDAPSSSSSGWGLPLIVVATAGAGFAYFYQDVIKKVIISANLKSDSCCSFAD